MIDVFVFIAADVSILVWAYFGFRSLAKQVAGAYELLGKFEQQLDSEKSMRRAMSNENAGAIRDLRWYLGVEYTSRVIPGDPVQVMQLAKVAKKVKPSGQ